ncbi:GtrA family protein [Photobacterium nomapromontoriensis]|uniref:GtrA family protein n=1 Tax=Photobacterium nomapromontoriensis TaxID=2910237 RepID=UPI003D0DEFCB
MLVGVLNTSVHFFTYFTLIASGFNQSNSNVMAFFVAVTCSYFLNAKFTFQAKYRPKEYGLYICFMGTVSYLIGYIGDQLAFPSIISLLTFSALSLFIGYKFSKILFLKEQ